MAPSVWSEIDVAEVLCGIYEETEQEAAGPSSSRGQQQEDMLKVDMGQVIRRRRLGEDGTGERERKCRIVQTQEWKSRRD